MWTLCTLHIGCYDGEEFGATTMQMLQALYQRNIGEQCGSVSNVDQPLGCHGNLIFKVCFVFKIASEIGESQIVFDTKSRKAHFFRQEAGYCSVKSVCCLQTANI